MTNTKQWLENEYQPWKRAMADFYDKEKMAMSNLQNNASELKYVVSLLLEKEEGKAAQAWNNLGLEPELKSIQLDLKHDVVNIETVSGETSSLALQTMLEELQRLLK